MNKKQIVISVLLCLFSWFGAPTLWAQKINFEIEIDTSKAIELNEILYVRYILHYDMGPDTLGMHPIMKLVDQPQGISNLVPLVGHTQNEWQWQGKIWTNQSTTQYTYRAMANELGKWKLPNAQASINDKIVQTDVTYIEIVPEEVDDTVDLIATSRLTNGKEKQRSKNIESQDVYYTYPQTQVLKDEDFELEIRCDGWIINDVVFAPAKHFSTPMPAYHHFKVSTEYSSDGSRNIYKNIRRYTLHATKDTLLTLPPILLKTSGGNIYTDSALINVYAAKEYNIQSTALAIHPREVYMQTRLSKDTVYAGEAIKLDYVLYSMLGTKIKEMEITDWGGFSMPKNSYPLQNKNRSHNTQQTVEDRLYETSTMYPYLLFAPYNTTKTKLDTPTAHFIYEVGVDEYENDKELGKIKLQTLQVPYEELIRGTEVTIKPYPQPMPNTFVGWVGTDFYLKTYLKQYKQKRSFASVSHVNRVEVLAGDTISYAIEIIGNGNLYGIEKEKIQLHLDSSMYLVDTQIDNKVHEATGAQGLTGSVLIEYKIIATQPGKFELPAVEITCFDLKKEQFVNKKGSKLQVEVKSVIGQ